MQRDIRNKEVTVDSVIVTRDKRRLVCGLSNGIVETRRVNDLRSVVSSFSIYYPDEHEVGVVRDNEKYRGVQKIVEIEDGTFVAGCSTNLKMWNEHGAILHNFNISRWITDVLELKSDNIVVSAERAGTIRLWSATTGVCLQVTEGTTAAAWWRQ